MQSSSLIVAKLALDNSTEGSASSVLQNEEQEGEQIEGSTDESLAEQVQQLSKPLRVNDSVAIVNTDKQHSAPVLLMR